MTTTTTSAVMDLAESSGLLAIGPLAVGLALVAVLIGAFLFGIRRRRSQPRPPRPDEQPQLPPDGPVGEVQENREPDEVPRSDHALSPHELSNTGTRTGEPKPRRRWNRS
ncbi:DUF6479 family protein [Streptomyces sp. NPDC088387]|uniref:DUF6479 family protein n=1 Tax=Streptomyces sp. NPDC088387 TaxID=3365859 RepID=UPI003819BB71